MTDNSRPVGVFGVGNALVDILAFVEDPFIAEQELDRGVMTLVDADVQGRILSQLDRGSLKLRSGGSAANTIIAIAQSGGSAFYTGKVSDDENGVFYRQDMQDVGVGFDVPAASATDGPTGTCVVLTTPDAERTMCTNLSISGTLAPSDINVEQLKQCQYSYVEGYLWTAPDPQAASIKTMEESKRHGVKVSFTLSDPFLLNSFRDDFQRVVTDYCDLLFCNADEVRQFLEIDSLDECAKKLGEMVDLAFITDSDKGCLVVNQKTVTTVEGFPVKPLDTVGAGDAFAGGVLYGLTNGYSNVQAARWGNYLGSAIVQIQGPRLEKAPVEEMARVMGS